MIVSKPVILHKLQAEMQSAGLPIQGLVGAHNSQGQQIILDTTTTGEWVELPPGSQAVIDAHDGTPPLTPDFGTDLPEDYADQLAPVVNQLRAYLALAAPTQAQSTAALKLMVRGTLFLLRRQLR